MGEFGSSDKKPSEEGGLVRGNRSGQAWGALPLRDCGRWLSGGTPNTENAAYWSGDIPWISASSLHNFYVETSDRRLTLAGLENGSRVVPESSILFVVRGMSLKS